MLAFKPNQFFNELEKISRHKKSSLQKAYIRAREQGLVEQQRNVIKLTSQGRRKIVPFMAEELSGRAYLMVIFDIPEDRFNTRRKFRQVLKEWNFRQVQKSVWVTGKDLKEEVIEIINEMQLAKYVQVYECARKFPK